MATKKNNELEEPVVQVPVDRVSYGGSVYDQQYFTDDELRAVAAARAAYQSGQTDINSAHDYAENIRANYGYSGGADGSKYIAVDRPTSAVQASTQFSYATAPQYVNKYAGQIAELTDQILNRPEFTYDPETDESYLAYKDQYTRLGQQAMKDTLGQVSARTGGLASSYATTASEQAYQNYMSALADRIPALKQAAYAMYQDQAANDRANLSMLQALESGDYAKYQDLLNQYNNDKGFSYQQYRDSLADQRYVNETDYNRGIDQRNYDYQLGRDALADQRYADELAYNRQLDQRNYDYQLSRDAVADARYADELAYNRGIDQRNYDYQLARDAVNDARYTDETAYSRQLDQRNYDYQIARDAVSDARYNTEWQYQVDQDAKDRAYSQALSAADAGNYSPLAKLLGVDLSTAQKLYDAEAAAQIRQANLAGYPTVSYSGGGGGGGGGSVSTIPTASTSDNLNAALSKVDAKTQDAIMRLVNEQIPKQITNGTTTEAKITTFLNKRVPEVAAIYGEAGGQLYETIARQVFAAAASEKSAATTAAVNQLISQVNPSAGQTATGTTSGKKFSTDMTRTEMLDWLSGQGLSTTLQQEYINTWNAANPSNAIVDSKTSDYYVKQAKGKYNSTTIWEYFAQEGIKDKALQKQILADLNML